MKLDLRALTASYGGHRVVAPATLELDACSHIGLIGPNGSGKTSFLKAIAGLVDSTGSALWNGHALDRMSAQMRARTVAYLSQSPRAHWPMRARDLVALGRLPHQRYGAAASDTDRAAVSEAMQITATMEFADRPMDSLSGGEFVRVQLARALCVKAPVLLVDEPTALLDPYHQLQIMAVLRSYANRGALVVSVLHDLTLAARFCHGVILMHGGRIIDRGRGVEVLSTESLEHAYRIEPLLGEHQNEPLIVPWRALPP